MTDAERRELALVQAEAEARFQERMAKIREKARGAMDADERAQLAARYDLDDETMSCLDGRNLTRAERIELCEVAQRADAKQHALVADNWRLVRGTIAKRHSWWRSDDADEN